MDYIKLSKIKHMIFLELDDAHKRYPEWPTDPVHAAAVVAEEAGELTQAVNNFYHRHGDQGSLEQMKKEAVQTGAMAIRFLMNLEMYDRKRCFLQPDFERTCM